MRGAASRSTAGAVLRTLIAEWRPHPGRAEPGGDGTGMRTGVVGDDPADGAPMGSWTSPGGRAGCRRRPRPSMTGRSPIMTVGTGRSRGPGRMPAAAKPVPVMHPRAVMQGRAAPAVRDRPQGPCPRRRQAAGEGDGGAGQAHIRGVGQAGRDPPGVSVIGWGGGEARVTPGAAPVHDCTEPPVIVGTEAPGRSGSALAPCRHR